VQADRKKRIESQEQEDINCIKDIEIPVF